MEYHQDLCSLRACRVSGRLDVQAAVDRDAGDRVDRNGVLHRVQRPEADAVGIHKASQIIRRPGPIDLQLSHYTALTSQYEANRRIRHDILHHVNTIRYLLANGQQQEATEYAGQLLAENQRSSQLGQCDNPVIDAFLYGRVQEAKAQGITVETHIILPVELPVSNTDLVIVFGNLMDNAVEACAKLENPKIELNAHIEKGYLVITESNPAVPEPEGRKQRRIPELERGVGMQILKSVAENYQGSCMSETGNGNYSVSVFLKLGQAKEGNAIYAENSCV